MVTQKKIVLNILYDTTLQEKSYLETNF